MTRYWIAVAHRKQALAARSAGFLAMSHGKKTAVAKLSTGDCVIYYAPKADFDAEPVQALVAHGTVTGQHIYERDMPGTEFRPWVIDASFAEAAEVPIRPLLESVSFVKDIRYWGMAFRRSQFEISQTDYQILAKAMGLG